MRGVIPSVPLLLLVLPAHSNDIGRYWLLQRNDGSGEPSQSLYHIPPDWLLTDAPNVITLVDVLGVLDSSVPRLVVTRLAAGTPPTPSGGYSDQILSCPVY